MGRSSGCAPVRSLSAVKALVAKDGGMRSGLKQISFHAFLGMPVRVALIVTTTIAWSMIPISAKAQVGMENESPGQGPFLQHFLSQPSGVSPMAGTQQFGEEPLADRRALQVQPLPPVAHTVSQVAWHTQATKPNVPPRIPQRLVTHTLVPALPQGPTQSQVVKPSTPDAQDGHRTEPQTLLAGRGLSPQTPNSEAREWMPEVREIAPGTRVSNGISQASAWNRSAETWADSGRPLTALQAEKPSSRIAADMSEDSLPNLDSIPWSQEQPLDEPSAEDFLEITPSQDPLVVPPSASWDLSSEDYLTATSNEGPIHTLPRFTPFLWGSHLLRTRRQHGDKGIGYERVAMAPFVIDIAQPIRQFAFRVDAVYGWGLPDRAEALFASPLKKPEFERSVSFQDLGFIAEVGSSAFSVRTLVPVRILDPELTQNTAGLGDVQVDTRLVLLNGKTWKLTQFLGTRMQSGSFTKGLGTGHFSLEPGVLASYGWSRETYWHSELRLLVPLGGDPLYQGNILRWGFGVSHLLYDSDRWAVIPTVESVFHSILDGQATGPNGIPFAVDGETISTLHFGMRIASDTGRDFGLVEMGVSGGFNLSSNGWYDSMIRFEIRTVY